MGDSEMASPALATPLGALDPAVSARLWSLRARLRAYVLLIGVTGVLAALFAAACVQFALDYFAHGLRWSMRAALLAVIVAGTIWLLRRCVVSPLRARMGPSDIAHLIERRHPQLATELISAVRFSSGQIGPAELNSPDLVASVIERAARGASPLDFDALFDRRRPRRAAITLIGIVLVSASAAVLAPDWAYLWLARSVLLREVPWPKRTRLVVDAEDGVLIGARGDDLVVSAHAVGLQPREVDIVYETASGHHGRQTMVTVGAEGALRYRYTFEKAQEDFVFYLKGGDDRTSEFQAKLVDRPRVVRTSMQIVPPAYTQQETLRLGDGQRSAQFLPGSAVTIKFETNQPVRQAELIAGDQLVAVATPKNEGFAVSLTPRQTQTYHFRLVNDVGLENREHARISLQLIKDESPRVRLKVPNVGEMITPEAVLPIELEVEDTYGLADARLVYRISREGAEESSEVPAAFRPRMTTFTATLHWPVASVGPLPGERLTLLARAADFDDVSGPKTSQSPEVVLRVVTAEELLAELARREQEFRADFERLIDTQEQLRSRLLTVLGQFTEQGGVEGLTEAILALERTQRNVSASVNVVRQQFERILAELEINRLDTYEVRERLSQGITEPLTQMVKRDFVEASDTIRNWSVSGSGELAGRIDPLQIEILAQMRAVLAKMLFREGYQEVVNMLRDILRLQDDLNIESRKTLERQAEEVFKEEQ
jgi:hypothetical protein